MIQIIHLHNALQDGIYKAYPQPNTSKSGFAPWSNFNRYRWSVFIRRQQLYPNNWEVFIANAAAITVANVNDVTTAEYFSKRAGKTIKQLTSWSSSSTRGEKASSTSGSSRSESIQDILPVEDMYNLWDKAGYVFFEGKAPPLIAVKSNYDDPRLPWHERAASNPMVKFWR